MGKQLFVCLYSSTALCISVKKKKKKELWEIYGGNYETGARLEREVKIQDKPRENRRA